MNDLISRQAAIEEISKQQTYKMFEGEDTVYLDANDAGGLFGVFVMCACISAGEADDREERWFNGR